MENKDDSIPFPQGRKSCKKNCTKDGQSLLDRKGRWENAIDRRLRGHSGIAPEEFKVAAKCMVFTSSRKKNVSDELTSGWLGPFIISKTVSEIL